jgi:hypothetical protein
MMSSACWTSVYQPQPAPAPVRPLRRITRAARRRLPNCSISSGVGSVRLRDPHCSTTRFQYVP